MHATRRRTARATAAVVIALGLGLGGCGGGEETIVTDDGTVTIDQDDGEGSITIDSSEGSMTISGESGGDLPDGWPDDVPVPEGGSVTASSTFAGDGGGAQQASLLYPDMSAEELAAEMTSSLTSQGFDVQGEVTTPEGSASSYTKGSVGVTVTTTDSDEGGVLVVVIAADG